MAGDSWFQRRAAVRARAKEAERGSTETIAEIIGYLSDKSLDVRVAACRALVAIAERGDSDSVAALRKAAVSDESSDVRAAAIEAMGSVAACAPDNVALISSVVANSGMEMPVRVAALAAFGAMAGDYWLEGGVCEGEEFASLATGVGVVAVCASGPEATLAKAALAVLPAAAPANPGIAAEAVGKALQSSTPHVRVAALAAHAALVQPGDASALNVAVGMLRDADSDVRRAAAATVAQVACQGDDKVVTALTAASRDSCSVVRTAVLQALAIVSSIAHDGATQVALAALRDSEAEVRKAALAAFSTVARRDDQTLVRAVGDLLASKDQPARLGGIAALQSLCGSRSDHGLKEVCKKVNHQSKGVRADMRRALVDLGAHDNPWVLDACAAGLRDSTKTEIRFDALLAIRELCTKGNEMVARHLMEIVRGDREPQNRRLAMNVLATAGYGCRSTSEAAATAMFEKDQEMRAEALATIVRATPSGDRFTIVCLVDMLPLSEIEFKDRAERRLDILKALASVAHGSDDECALQALVERTQDLDARVRSAALLTLQKVATRGNEVAINAAAELLQHADPATRKEAISRFRFFAEPWDPRAVRAALRGTSSDWWENRVASLHALAGIVNPSLGAPSGPSSDNDLKRFLLARLGELAQSDEYQPVKTAAANVLRHLESGTPIPFLDDGGMTVAVLGDHKRFVKPAEDV